MGGRILFPCYSIKKSDMKKLLVIPLVLLCTGLFAQRFQFGLKAGVNLSNFSGLTWENVDNKARLGFHGGAFLNLMFGDHFSIAPEALFSSQGAKLESAGQEQNFKVSYLAVPVMLKYRFDGGFYLEAGPQVSFKIDEDTDEQPIDNFAKNLDLGIGAGLGYHSDMGLGVGARYVAGIYIVGDFDVSDLGSPDFRNGVAQVFIFYTLFNNRK
jgi:hypothetical protein